MIWENFLVFLCKQEGFKKINKSVKNCEADE